MACLFCKIIGRELPAKVFYESPDVVVIADKYPKDEVHLLVIPRAHHENFYQTPEEVLGAMNQAVKIVVERLGIIDHFRVQINNGYGQEIGHIHYHILSNRGAHKLNYEG